MKIKKTLNKIKLKEDIDEPISVDQPVSEIADDLQDQAADVGVELSDTAAKEVAKETKEISDIANVENVTVTSDDDSIGVTNAITKSLDKSLAVALKNKRRGGTDNVNILIVGLPGSGKSASVRDWAKRNNINLVYVKSTSSDLDAILNGYPTVDPKDLTVTLAVSKVLDSLEKERSVLFLDEFNRQKNAGIRGSLFTLINEHYVVGKEDGNIHYFKNLLFTIICINPAVVGDTGVSDLLQAELARFKDKIIEKGSDPVVTYEYLEEKYNKEIDKLLNPDRTLKNPSDPYVLEDLEDYLRIQHLGQYIVSDPTFEVQGYNTIEDLEDIQNSGIAIRKTLLNQRSLVDGLAASFGKVDDFKDWVEHYADFMPDKTELLLTIAETYIEPSFEDLCKAKNIVLDPANSATINKDAADTTNSSSVSGSSGTQINSGTNIDQEDDTDIWSFNPNATSSAVGAQQQLNPTQTKMTIQQAIKNW